MTDAKTVARIMNALNEEMSKMSHPTERLGMSRAVGVVRRFQATPDEAPERVVAEVVEEEAEEEFDEE